MQKYRVGLQKDFSEIFDSVWIPKRTRTKKPTPALGQKQQQQQQQIKNIIAAMKCAKNFQCYKSGFMNLCKAKLVPDIGLVEC